MSYDGLTLKTDEREKHLGGNILEGDPHTYSPAVWDYVFGRFAIKTVMDLGSGMGYAADYFFRKGARVIAVEGLDENVKNAVYPTLKIDLTRSSVVCNVDLVHCQEVVEHIEEKYLENLLSSLACGKFVLMTHALPGQDGYHHVNLKPREYWVGHMKRHGFAYLVEDSERVRRIAKSEGALFLEQSALLFAKT